jgi:hypothetical protein
VPWRSPPIKAIRVSGGIPADRLTVKPIWIRFHDDLYLGGKYKLAKASIGNEKWSGDRLVLAGREMISDVPVEIRLVFSGLPEGVTKITKLIVAAIRGPFRGGAVSP